MSISTIESIVRYVKRKLIEETNATDDKTIAIACSGLFQVWDYGIFEAGDIRTDPDTGYPLECIMSHDSTINTDWTIKVRTVWKPYHSRSPEWALPWEQPTGEHDMYKAGEYMIWTDGFVHECVENTNFSPEDYPQAWKVVIR